MTDNHAATSGQQPGRALAQWQPIDSRPYAQVHVSEDRMTPEALHELTMRLIEVNQQMNWYRADLLGAGEPIKHRTKMHILHKVDYEQNHSCKALCGKSATWDPVFVLDPGRDPGRVNVCKACYEHAQGVHNAWPPAPAKQESEAKGDGNE